MNNRRRFIAAGAALVCAGAVPAWTAVGSRAAPGAGGSPSRAQFEALANQVFRVRDAAGQRGELMLASVRSKAGRPGLEQFSLVLRGKPGQSMRGGLCYMDHAQTGAFALSIEGSGQDERGLLYRAEFSLLT